MNKLIKIMKEDKLKFVTIMVAIMMFVAGVVVSMVSTGDTYADSSSDYSCPLGGSPAFSTTSSTGYMCVFSEIGVSVGDYTFENYNYTVGTKIQDRTHCESYLIAVLEKTGKEYIFNENSNTNFCIYDAVPSTATVTATFDANGGSVSPTSKTCSYNVENGERECSIILPTPTRNGHSFSGWRIENTGTPIKGETNISTDTTFTAVWTRNSGAVTPDTAVTATFDANGGSVSPTSKTCSYNVGNGERECSITLPTPTRNGHSFSGWRIENTGTPIKGETNISSDTTFTAVWTRNSGAVTPDTTVTATFDANGGSVSPTSKTCSYNVENGERECSIILPTPTRNGHSFSGWRIENTGTPIKGETNISTDTTFTAVWTRNSGAVTPDTTVTATFDANGGSVSPTSKTCSYNVENGERECSITLPTPTRNGHSFSGWRIENTDTPIKGETNISSDTTFTAVWTQNSGNVTPDKYTVIFDANGGTGAPKDQTKTAGKTLTLSSVEPTRNGYTFLGWGIKDDATEVNYNPGDSYTEDASITLYAVWQSDDDKTDDEVNTTPPTGDVLIYIVYIVGICALGYSIYYFIRRNSL